MSAKKPTDELGCQRRATLKLFRDYMTGWHPFLCLLLRPFCSVVGSTQAIVTLGRKSAPVVGRQRFSPALTRGSIVQVEDRKTSERKFAEFAEFLKEFV